jgi:hypothetical protein
MGLPWIRLDSNIGQHDKVLALLSDPSPKKWQAFSSYVCALGWSGGQGTDGRVPVSALPFIHGTMATARLLVKYGLWVEHDVTGFRIHNFEGRQQSQKASEALQASKSAGGTKGNCVRWHGPDCGCWKREGVIT